jgi:hypothetical protein
VTEASGKETGAVVAFYPCSSDLILSCAQDGTLTLDNVLYPSEQKYLSSSFANSSFPMISVNPAGENELQFRNLGGVLHLKVRGNGSVSKVILESNAGEFISGNASVTVTQGNLPVIAMHDNASASISLLCDPPLVLSEDKVADLYFSLPPVEFTSGFTVTFDYGEKGILVKQTAKPQNVKRSAILHMPEFTLADMSGPFVDLGLSVKWATMNVGASAPEEYGHYYAWGETEEKKSFSKGNYAYFDSQLMAYQDIGEDISGTKYDAATDNWGEGWRIPTKDEVVELMSKCKWEYSYEYSRGLTISGNGNSIFLNMTYDNNCRAYYWTSSVCEDSPYYAYYLYFDQYSSYNINIKSGDRESSFFIRPVKDKK